MATALSPLVGKQRQAARGCTARLNILEGSVRSSKTVSSLFAWLQFVRQGPPGNLLMVGKTERTLKRNIIDVLTQWVGPKRCRYVQGSGELWLLGRLVYVVGANDERAQDKIRGLTLAGAYGDEVSTWPESFFRMLLSRLSVKGARFIGTSNPENPYHWLKREYLDRAGELDLKSWHFTLEDNPHLDPAYVEALKREYTGLWYKRFILGLWVMAEGIIYDQFDEERHVIDSDPGGILRWVAGVDYGTSNPTVFLLLGWDGKRWHVVREYYWDARAQGRQKTDGQYAEDMKRFLGDLRPAAIYVDPSAASFIAELRSRGIGPVMAANHDVLPGIQTVSRLLEHDELAVVRGACPNTLREFGAYAWDPKAQQRGEDAPIKQYDHAMDALRYALHTELGGAQLETGTLDLPW